MAPSAVAVEEDTVSSLTEEAMAKIKVHNASSVKAASLAPLDASRLEVHPTPSPRAVPLPEHAFTRRSLCTDHMLTCTWDDETGWGTPQIKEYGPLSLAPTASCLHYATECFEGTKLYRGYDGRLRLFRPQLNCKRMQMSAQRIALPSFDDAELLKLIVALCARDGPKWLPKSRAGLNLYVRPTMIATEPAIGVQKPGEALLFIILSFIPSLSDNPRGLRLLASQEDTVRAWPGGFGYAKVGANYGPTLLATGEAKAKGFDQILWLLGDARRQDWVTEAGASNFFAVWRTREGQVQLVTAPLGEKIILDGVTRRSVLELARARLAGEVEVVERSFGMQEIADAVREGRMLEAFAAGTAFFIAPVSLIHFRGVDLPTPMAEGDSGYYTKMIKNWLKGIMFGKEKHEWGFVVEEEDED